MKWPWSKAPIGLNDAEMRKALEFEFLEHAFPHRQSECIGTLCDRGHPDLFIRLNGQDAGYVHEWAFEEECKTVLIGHFAVAKELEGRGFGEPLIRGFASALKRDCDTERIVFRERKYSNAYEKLFIRLGAQAHDHPQYPGKPDWIWTFESR